MKKICFLFFVTFSIYSWSQDTNAAVFYTESGEVSFLSDAPLEKIEATSTQLKGVIEPSSGKFAFSVSIISFLGFNSPLQREHFNENYLESKHFPKATFSGKIIEQIDFEKDGIYQIRAKGKFDVHGVSKERIIKSELQIKGQEISIISDFVVILNEYNIIIPKIVHQKIADEIKVKVSATLLLK